MLLPLILTNVHNICIVFFFCIPFWKRIIYLSDLFGFFFQISNTQTVKWIYYGGNKFCAHLCYACNLHCSANKVAKHTTTIQMAECCTRLYNKRHLSIFDSVFRMKRYFMEMYRNPAALQKTSTLHTKENQIDTHSLSAIKVQHIKCIQRLGCQYKTLQEYFLISAHNILRRMKFVAYLSISWARSLLVCTVFFFWKISYYVLSSKLRRIIG